MTFANYHYFTHIVPGTFTGAPEDFFNGTAFGSKIGMAGTAPTILFMLYTHEEFTWREFLHGWAFGL